MNAKEQYKLAYRLVRLFFVERAEESTNSYPYWFDCPSRHECETYHPCICLQELEASNVVYGYAKEEHRRIVPLVSDQIKVIAQEHYFNRHMKVPTCGLVQKLVNSGGFWNFKAYPGRQSLTGKESSNWRWSIFKTIPPWNVGYSPTIEEEKARLRQLVIEALDAQKA